MIDHSFVPAVRRAVTVAGLAVLAAASAGAQQSAPPSHRESGSLVLENIPPPAPALVASLGPDWTDADLPGMTGIARTVRPISEPPGDLVLRLARLDPA